MINIYTYNVYILSNVSKVNILSNVKTLFIAYLADIFLFLKSNQNNNLWCILNKIWYLCIIKFLQLKWLGPPIIEN